MEEAAWPEGKERTASPVQCAPGRCGEMWRDVGRCREMWGDVERYGEMWEIWGGMARYGEGRGGMAGVAACGEVGHPAQRPVRVDVLVQRVGVAAPVHIGPAGEAEVERCGVGV